jgi:hypothetical protein
MDLAPDTLALLSRIQFAFTVSFHIIFPAFTIGLSAFIATLLIVHLRTGREHYRTLARFWTKVFAVSFAMGVCRASCCRTSSAPTGAGSRRSPATSSAR